MAPGAAGVRAGHAAGRYRVQSGLLPGCAGVGRAGARPARRRGAPRAPVGGRRGTGPARPRRGGPVLCRLHPGGADLVWAESVTAKDGTPKTELWRADLAGGAPRLVTADTGWATFANSEYDLVVASGRVYWAASAPGPSPATQVRSVPLGGGPVRVDTEPGTWTLAGWPWLVGSGGGQRGPVRIRDLDSGRTTTVEDRALDRCGPAWCRLFVLSGDAPVRSELMRPDGSDRQTAADNGATPAIGDVAVLDRFEVLSGDSSTIAAAVGGQRLLVYDMKTRQLVAVADAASRVSYRAGVLWWATNAGTNTTWHTLDLRTV
ncbi:hypothetical protein ACFQ1L_20545 [Phytohabitans flavus]|uniref:hypothetical protein n=1 Tax=Phytohabitans flavus TaxID=1076124 RepID=UPI00362B9106